MKDELKKFLDEEEKAVTKLLFEIPDLNIFPDHEFSDGEMRILKSVSGIYYNLKKNFLDLAEKQDEKEKELHYVREQNREILELMKKLEKPKAKVEANKEEK